MSSPVKLPVCSTTKPWQTPYLAGNIFFNTLQTATSNSSPYSKLNSASIKERPRSKVSDICFTMLL